jgi:hypothetical protein
MDIACHATEPLRVAVMGDVSTGKSALVNALLGRHEAAVRFEEATATVTWFRPPGAPCPASLAPGHVSKPVVGPLSDVITLVDTPGFNSVSGNVKLTEAMLQVGEAVAGPVSVVVYLVDCTIGVDPACLARLKRFSALTRGEFESHAAIVLVGSKADFYGSPGLEGSNKTRQQMSLDLLDSVDQIARDLVESVDQKVPGLVEYAVGLMPAMAEGSRTLTETLAQQVLALATHPVLGESLHKGWPDLKEEAATLDPPVDFPWLELGELFGSSAGLCCVAESCANREQHDVTRSLRGLLQDLSGLGELERRLRYLASIGGVLTTSAVTRRLQRLAASLGPSQSGSIMGILNDCRQHPAMAGYHRAAAAVVADGPAMQDVLSGEDRAAGAALLLGHGPGLTEAARGRWHQATGPGRPLSQRHVAQLVLDLSLPGRAKA